MNPELGQDAIPGMGPRVDGTSRTFLAHSHYETRGIIIDADTEDDGNDPTTKLRAGLVLVKVVAGPNVNKFVHSEHADAPADADITEAVILNGKDVNLLDKASEPEDKVATGVFHGLADEDKVFFGTAVGARIAAMKAAMPLVAFVKKD
jgi:hypothetical protein